MVFLLVLVVHGMGSHIRLWLGTSAGPNYNTPARQQATNNFNTAYGVGMAVNAPYFSGLNQQNQLATQLFGYNTQQNQLNYRDAADQSAKQQALADLGLRGVDVERSRLNQDPGFIDRDYGLDMRTAENRVGTLAEEFTTGMRNLTSDATARGALSTEGSRESRADLIEQYYRGIEDVNIFKGKEGLQKDIGMADYKVGMDRLGLEAEKYGIDKRYAAKAIDNALAQMGLQGKIDSVGLAKILSSNEADKVAKGNEILFQALAIAGQK